MKATTTRNYGMACAIRGDVRPCLDAIQKNDPELNAVMRQISDYALGRLTKAERGSETFRRLQRLWNKLNKRDRAAFLAARKGAT